MEAAFWHERWSKNQIGFHESAVNPLLVAHSGALGLGPGAHVLVPLCGMSLDIDWLLEQGCRVTGVELSSLAIERLFARLGLQPVVATEGALECWRADGLAVFVGDFFLLPHAAIGQVDAVYDRAALIALPPQMRQRYATHLDRVADGAPQLLVTLQYDQAQVAGPPFCVDEQELRRLYGNRTRSLLSSQVIAGGLKGRCPATENVWLLDPVTG